MALVVCRWPFTTENRVRSQVGLCEIRGGKWHWLCPSNSVLLCQLVPIFHQCSIPIFIYMLFLPGGQTGDACELSEIDRQKFSLFSVLKD